jgi:alkanesulfonate monooxygenase SsuD/methylene tetrahydromethanopterin reductase-like flavin-dependent oxidoreductase (luciferase family)
MVQFAGPIRCIAAGTKTERMMNASMRTEKARPKPNSFKTASSEMMKDPNTRIMIMAAATITRPLLAWPISMARLSSQMGAPESLAAFVQRTSVVGSPETVAAQLGTFAVAGLEHVHARFAFGSLDDLGPFRRSLDLFVSEVMPRIDAQPMPALAPDEIAGHEPSLVTAQPES